MAEGSNENQITFKYAKSPEYRTVYANGVHGGISARGDFRFDLFIETQGTPDTITHLLTPDGLGPESGREPAKMPIVRELQTGVLMSIEQAAAFAEWIQRRIADYRQAQKEQRE